MSLIDVDAFLRDGYAVVPELFSPDEAERFRNDTIELVERLDREGLATRRGTSQQQVLSPPGDMLTHESLRRILLDPRLIGAVREILGGEPAFWGESGVNVGDYRGGARAWHTDAYATPVTKGARYPLVRCGLYLQDTVRHSDGVAIVKGSHAQDVLASKLTSKIRMRALPWVGWLGSGKSVLVESRPGDLVIWDMRVLHAGEVIRFKPAPTLTMPLVMQGRLPKALRMPRERRRVVMFPTFGLPGPDLDSYLAYQMTHDWMQDLWRSAEFPESVVSEAAAAGLQVIRPVPCYGRAAADADQAGMPSRSAADIA